MTEPRPTLSNPCVNLNHWEQCVCVCQALSCVSVSHAFRLCKHLHRNEMGVCPNLLGQKKQFGVFLDL